jgi:outer membrane protein OmpA-like peptidoglycan-associated protein
VWDGLDQCEGTPAGARVDARGCPTDADGDAVFDGIDQCADTPNGAKVDDKGCTSDADGDGVVDGLDRCESTPKGCTIDDSGCPTDEDRDGVCDGIDLCPGTGANLRVDQQGCPIEVTEKETELLDTGMMRLENVQFETAKADLKPEAMTQLDIVGQVLTKWPDLKIEIGGHTDARGSNAYNQRLSEARVESVLGYLIQKFTALKAEQYTTRGYGESKPLVPNVSPEAMARNRRVEFVVLNREVLKREIERRRLLQRNDTGN